MPRTDVPYNRLRIGDLPYLERKEEKALWRRYQKGDIEAGNTIVLHHLPLALRLADSWRSSGVDFDDLLSVAVQGLYDAFSTFDPDKGNFRTHAWSWGRTALREHVTGEGEPTTVPLYLRARGLRLAREALYFSRKFGRAPTAEELAGRIGKPLSSVRHAIALHSARQGVSFEEPFRTQGYDSEHTLQDTLQDFTCLTPELFIEAQDELREAKARVAEHFRRVGEGPSGERNRRLFELHYRMKEDESFPTLEETATAFGISRERVRQILAKHFTGKLTGKHKEITDPLKEDLRRIPRLEELIEAHPAR